MERRAPDATDELGRLAIVPLVAPRGGAADGVADYHARLDRVRAVFGEYAAWVVAHEGAAVLAAQGFVEEVAALPGEYAPPRGALFVAEVGDHAAGCVAIRPWSETVAELKRLYVRPGFRGYSLGRRLTVAAMDAAARLGYRRLRLDTLSFMERAIAMYQSLGFQDVEPYRANPMPGARFFEIALGGENDVARVPGGSGG